MKILDIWDYLQLVSCIYVYSSWNESILKKSFQKFVFGAFLNFLEIFWTFFPFYFTSGPRILWLRLVVIKPVLLVPWNQLQMATNILNFQRKKTEPIYIDQFLRYSILKSGLILSTNFDDFKEILVQVNKAVYGQGSQFTQHFVKGHSSIK